MTLALMLLLATFAAADALMRGTDKVDRKTDAQQETRRALDTVVAQLRDARPAPSDTTPLAVGSLPTRSSVVFSGRLTRDQNASGTAGWVRICAAGLTSPAQVLVGSKSAGTFSDPGTCTVGTNADGWTYGPLLARRITNPGSLFNFSSASCVGSACTPTTAELARGIRTVGVTLTVDAGRDDPAFTASDAVSIRNRTR